MSRAIDGDVNDATRAAQLAFAKLCDREIAAPSNVMTCAHAACTPHFDPLAASLLSDAEIRRQFPRFMGTCPTCGEQVIAYASWAHYIAGDW